MLERVGRRTDHPQIGTALLLRLMGQNLLPESRAGNFTLLLIQEQHGHHTVHQLIGVVSHLRLMGPNLLQES